MKGFSARREDRLDAAEGRLGAERYKEVSRTRRFMELARGEWRLLACGTLFLFVSSAAGLVFPQAVRLFMDEVGAGGGREIIDQAALIMAAVFVVQGVAGGLRYYLFTLAGERIVMGLRRRLYQRILSQEIGFFDERRTGELISRLSTDTGVLQNAVSVNISMALRNVVGVLGGIALLAYTSLELTALMLFVVPPIAIGAVVAGRIVRRYSRSMSDAMATAGNVAEETIAGVRTVRLFAREQTEVARYDSAIGAAFAIARGRIRVMSLFQIGVGIIGLSSLVLVLWYGGRLVLDGEMSVGELTAFLLYTTGVAVSLAALASLWGGFMRSAGAGDRVFDLLDRVPRIGLVEGARPVTDQGEVRFEDVSFSYPSRSDIEVLDSISLKIQPGEVVALVGPSGGGKSTIASLIPRLYDVNQGRITLDGKDITELSPEWLRSQMATVAQQPLLFSMSIYDNIAYGAGREDITPEEVEAAARAASAHDFIMEFPEGYQTEVGERGVKLSGGQKQRVAIARAVLRDPRILILDEATSALDTENEALVQAALERLMSERTTLVIAHRLSTITGADRVLVIDDGKVIQTGTHAELIEEPDGLYRRLVERQYLSRAG